MEGHFNSCETIQKALIALLDNELSEVEAAAARVHLGVCPGCRQHFESLRQTVRAADAWAIEGTDILQRLEYQIASEAKPASSRVALTAQQVSDLLWTRVTAEQLAQALCVYQQDGVGSRRSTEDTGSVAEQRTGEPNSTEQTSPVKMPTETDSQNDFWAVLGEMRALRTEIQQLRGEVGTLRRLLSVTQQTPIKTSRPLSPPQLMPLALPDNCGIGLL